MPMQARKGRASYLGERSIGHQDPGATSTALIVRALGRALVTAGLMAERVPAADSRPRRAWRSAPPACSAARPSERRPSPTARRPRRSERAARRAAAAAAELEALAARLRRRARRRSIETGALMAGDPALVDDVERAVLDGLPAAGRAGARRRRATPPRSRRSTTRRWPRAPRTSARSGGAR